MDSDSRSTDTSGHLAWQAALAVAAVAGTLAIACMMPFVAVAVATAATMSRARAAATLGAVWATNQLFGFTLLGYPRTASAFAWGAALGVAGVCAMVVAAAMLGSRRGSAAMLAAAFAAAFATYELALFGFALAVGPTSAFTAPIVLQILANDAIWFAALIALHAVLTRAAPRTFGAALRLRAA